MNRFLKGFALFVLGLGTITLGWSLKEDKLGEVVRNVAVSNNLPAARIGSAAQAYVDFISGVYAKAHLEETGMDSTVFRRALTGYLNLKETGKLSEGKQILTVVDFNKPSTEKRLWVIDLASHTVLFNTYVAHGQGSGDNMATSFSNRAESHQSSLGFYVTDETYQGKHGLSLRLNGLDRGFNTNAHERAVVIHGADYVSDNFIAKHGRLGRSYGCPAIPVEFNAPIIQQIKGKTALFINAPEGTKYNSDYLNEERAASLFTLNRA